MSDDIVDSDRVDVDVDGSSLASSDPAATMGSLDLSQELARARDAAAKANAAVAALEARRKSRRRR